MLKVHGISLKSYESIRYSLYSSFSQEFLYLYSIQTLSVLNLELNAIGTRGTQHLADALKNNNVRERIVLSTDLSSNLFLDCENIDSFQ